MIHAWVVNQLNERPNLGFVATGAGAVSAVLTVLGWITPLVGFTAAVLGVVAGYYTARIKRAEWKRIQAEEAVKKQNNNQ